MNTIKKGRTIAQKLQSRMSLAHGEEVDQGKREIAVANISVESQGKVLTLKLPCEAIWRQGKDRVSGYLKPLLPRESFALIEDEQGGWKECTEAEAEAVYADWGGSVEKIVAERITVLVADMTPGFAKQLMQRFPGFKLGLSDDTFRVNPAKDVSAEQVKAALDVLAELEPKEEPATVGEMLALQGPAATAKDEAGAATELTSAGLPDEQQP